MPTYIDDNAIGDDAEKTARDDAVLAVRFTVEKRLNHALMTKVADANRELEDRAKLLEIAGKFDDAKAERAKKYPDEPIYREIEFITINIPGDKTLNVHRPIMPSFHAAWSLGGLAGAALGGLAAPVLTPLTHFSLVCAGALVVTVVCGRIILARTVSR